jgi:ribonuclease-3
VLGRRETTRLERALGYRFRDARLLELALTHRSYANEQELEGHNERLEFLGDAILGTVAAEWLYREHPELPEGDLSKLKAYLVSAPALAGFSIDLGVGRQLRLGVGEERSGGRSKPSLLADTLEAVFGAIYLDGGVASVRKVVTPLLEQVLEERPTVHEGDSKTRLQEMVQARGWELPEYRVVEEAGPDHAKHFTIECLLRGRPAGRGEGRSKKVAEQKAAAQALDGLLAEERLEAGEPRSGSDPARSPV